MANANETALREKSVKVIVNLKSKNYWYKKWYQIIIGHI